VNIILRKILIFSFLFLLITNIIFAQNNWWKNLKTGILTAGKNNAITDVKGVRVGHTTLIKGENCRTGVTVILPHISNVFLSKVPAAIYIANGFGKLTGYTQVKELGVLETPIVLTNTLSVPVAANALIRYTLKQKGNERVRSVNPLIGETNDGKLNNIRAMFIKEKHIFEAIKAASSGFVKEGNVGAGTGTICFGYKGGIGTSSRVLPISLGGFTIGVLVQTNFGGILNINGAPVGKKLKRYYLKNRIDKVKPGSCMIVVATDAPLNSRQLFRLAKRSFQGFIRSGGISSNGSGDYVIAFSTNSSMRHKYRSEKMYEIKKVLRDEKLSPLFLAAAEATQEAIYRSLFAADDMKGNGKTIRTLPKNKVKEILKEYNLLDFK